MWAFPLGTLLSDRHPYSSQYLWLHRQFPGPEGDNRKCCTTCWQPEAGCCDFCSYGHLKNTEKGHPPRGHNSKWWVSLSILFDKGLKLQIFTERQVAANCVIMEGVEFGVGCVLFSEKEDCIRHDFLSLKMYFPCEWSWWALVWKRISTFR